jgi:hypothetical protein
LPDGRRPSLLTMPNADPWAAAPPHPLPHPLREQLGPFLTVSNAQRHGPVVRERASQGLTEAPGRDSGSGDWKLQILMLMSFMVIPGETDQDVEAVPPGTESAR